MQTETQTYLYPDPSRRVTRSEAAALFAELLAYVAGLEFQTDIATGRALK